MIIKVLLTKNTFFSDSDESTDDQVSKSNHDDDDLADKPEDEIIQEVEPEPGYTAERISETDDVSLEGIGNANISEGTDTDKVDENEADQVINVTNLDVIESVDTIQEVPPTIEARFADDDEILQEDLENFKVCISIYFNSKYKSLGVSVSLTIMPMHF